MDKEIWSGRVEGVPSEISPIVFTVGQLLPLWNASLDQKVHSCPPSLHNGNMVWHLGVVQQLKQGTENGFKPWECFLTCITLTLFSCNLTLEVEWDADAVPFSVLSCSSHPLAPSFSNNTPSPILCRCWWANTMHRPSRTLWKTYFLCAITMTTICLSLKEDLSISQQASGSPKGTSRTL